MTSPPKKVSPRRERAKGKAGSNSSPTNPVSYVVGIGASAGGLEALERFFKATPSNTGMAFVVIQHLSPDFKSLMDELLARFTQMRLVRVQGPTPVEADTIYLIPPRKEMILEEGLLVLVDRVPDQQLHMPINRFFRSLAREKHEKAIAIVLSGTGSDGSLGLMDVHDSGGLVLVQSEQTAKFDGMPRSAVATGFADSVAAPEEMPALLMRYILNPARPLPQTAARAEGGMGVILERLREGYGIDFSLYKPATITRRIERRLALAQVSTIEEYCQTILREPLELDALYRDLLIGVTRFFRDPEAFEVLREKVAPGLVEGIGPAEDLRVWIPGCATGEEAYSIGMMLLKEFDRRQRPANLKIFATDVHRDSLRIAAEGIYPEAAMESVPADLREEFFSREPDGRLRVVARLRKAMLFSPQNLIKDVPFNRIDFISCRNLLIYFQPSAQTRAITAFHFALKLKGTLLLGPSESTGELERDFETLDRHWKIYRKISETRAPMEMRLQVPPGLPVISRPVTGADTRLTRIYDQLLGHYLPPGVLVNDKREALHIFGEASRFLRSPSGRVSHDVITLCEGDLRVAVSSALQSCLKRSERVALREVQITLPGGDKGIIDVVAEPVLDRATNSTFVFVKFLEERKPRQHDGAHALVLDDEVKGRVMQLESELQGTRESLQTMVEELETTNEELQASNEELLASNEELQSTNEELHSVNEELYSVNAEHEQKIRELAATTADLRNLIAVTHTGIVFIDRQHCIRLFTPGAAQLLNLMPQDVGRPIAHITSRIKGDDIFDDLRLADETRQPLEKAITTADGAHFLRRITPYHDADKQHNGMVVSFTDITAMTRVEAEKRTLINAIIDTSPAHKAVIDESGVIQATNRTWEQFTRTHGLGPQATGIGASYFEACAAIFGDANAAQVTGHIREVLSGQRERADFDYPCGPPNQDQWFWMTVSRFTHNHSVGAVITHTNITSRKISERALADAASRFRTMHDNMPIGMLTIDDQAIIRHANPSALKLLGYPEDELVGLHLETCIHEPQRKNHRQHFAAFMKAPMTRIMSGRSMLARRKDGSSFAAEIGISPAEFDGERFIMTFISDVTERNRIADEKLHIQRKLEETAKLESLGVLAGGIAHDFNNILTGILGNTEVAQQQLPKGSPLHPCLTDVITACLRASDLCKQMLAYAGKGRFILQHSDLSALVRETTSLIRLSISKKTSLHLELADGLPRVEIDESQIRQVVMNLVINASESFGDKAGDIHIRTGRARGATDGSGTLMIAHEGAADDFAYLEVEDNGCGISPENLKRIFDPFFTTKFVGRGLGLAAVQGIVRSHKGMLGVQSKVGQGTKFRLLLPCALTTVTESPAPPAAPASITRSGRILLVDDEPIVLITSRRILEHAGYQCLTANTGSEAVQLLSTTPDHIDLVVLDLTMPGISGGKTYELMRELRPHLKVILSSGYNENEAIAQFGDGELAGFLPKPVSAQLLLNMVNTALSSAAPEENKGMVHISHPQSASATNQ